MDIESIITNLKDMLTERGDDISLFEEHRLSIDKEEYENDRNVIELQTSNTTVIFALTKKLRKFIKSFYPLIWDFPTVSLLIILVRTSHKIMI